MKTCYACYACCGLCGLLRAVTPMLRLFYACCCALWFKLLKSLNPNVKNEGVTDSLRHNPLLRPLKFVSFFIRAPARATAPTLWQSEQTIIDLNRGGEERPKPLPRFSKMIMALTNVSERAAGSHSL